MTGEQELADLETRIADIERVAELSCMCGHRMIDSDDLVWLIAQVRELAHLATPSGETREGTDGGN